MGHAGGGLVLLPGGRAADVHSLVVPGSGIGYPLPVIRRHPHQLLGLPVQSGPAGHRGRRPDESGNARPRAARASRKAVATVFVDRIIGLYVLFIVASAAILLTGFWRIDDVQWVCNLTFVITAASTIGLGVLIYPGVTGGRLSRAMGRIPHVGRYIESLIDAVRMYKSKPLVLTGRAADDRGRAHELRGGLLDDRPWAAGQLSVARAAFRGNAAERSHGCDTLAHRPVRGRAGLILCHAGSWSPKARDWSSRSHTGSSRC